MTKARKLGVPTPVLLSVDPVLHSLTFEYVEGPMVKETFLEFGSNGIVEERLQDIATQIGNSIAKLHDGGLVHGDLTTSNMLIRKDTNQLVRFYSDILWLERNIKSLNGVRSLSGKEHLVICYVLQVLIDFGLSFTSALPEDKAVDLYVLERALVSMHSSCGNVVGLFFILSSLHVISSCRYIFFELLTTN